MRIEFCFISNNIRRIKNLYDNNFRYNLENPSNKFVESYKVNVVLNPPITRAVLFYPINWNLKWINIPSRPATDYFWLRQESFDMAKHSDLIFVGDDDMKFLPGSTEIINQCVDYMDKHPDCGAIYLGGNLGGLGKSHGNEIFITNTGSLGTNRGIIVRNHKDGVLDNRLHALGACEDAAIAFTALIRGYYIARRLNVKSIEHIGSLISEDSPNINYNLNFIKSKGIRASVSRVIGKWEDRSKWPDHIFARYLEAYNKKNREYYNKYMNNGDIVENSEKDIEW